LQAAPVGDGHGVEQFGAALAESLHDERALGTAVGGGREFAKQVAPLRV
jgi:hypothetical protein